MNEREWNTDTNHSIEEKGVSAYIKQISRIPLLSPEEERKLAYRIKKGDGSARRKMILSNLRLVVSIAKKYVGLGVPFLDLIEEGNIGLMKAVEKFDPDRGTKFSTYATWWIQQHILRALSSQSRTVRVPAYLSEQLSRARKAIENHFVSTGRQLESEDLAKTMGISVQEAEQLISYLEVDMSFNALQDIQNWEQLESIDKSNSPIGKYAFSTPFDVIQDLNSLVSLLPEKYGNVIRYRYGLMDGKPHTLTETAMKFNIPREQVRRYERYAIKVLREYVMKNKDQIDI